MRADNQSLEQQLNAEVRQFSRKVISRVKKLGLHDIVEPSTDPKLIEFTDITKLADQEVGKRYFAIQSWSAYAQSCAARADIEVIYSKEQMEMAFAKAILTATGSSAEDRKAEAQTSPRHRYWTRVYLEKFAAYKLLHTTALSYERFADSYSREISRRRIAWESSREAR